MQAIKNAILIKEKNPGTEITILYMDIRSYGKGYEEYFERAKTLGIRFIRGIPSDILADKGGMSVQVEDTEKGTVQSLHPGLIVLSVGIGPSDTSASLANTLGVTCEKTGFFHPVNDAVDTVATIRPGIYLAGTACAPKDIPDCVASGGAAAMRAYIDAVRSKT
jgi:heterodisulfide reductase subunit A